MLRLLDVLQEEVALHPMQLIISLSRYFGQFPCNFGTAEVDHPILAIEVVTCQMYRELLLHRYSLDQINELVSCAFKRSVKLEKVRRVPQLSEFLLWSVDLVAISLTIRNIG